MKNCLLGRAVRMGQRKIDLTKRLLNVAAKVALVFISVEVAFRIVAPIYVWKNLYLKTRTENIASDAYRILCVGESTTQGVGAPEGRSWPDQLQLLFRGRMPNTKVQVFNRGVGGITALECHRHFKRNLRLYRPHLVLIQLGNNNVGASDSFWGESTWGKRSGWLFNRSKVLRALKLLKGVVIATVIGDGFISESFGQFYFSGGGKLGEVSSMRISNTRNQSYIEEIIRLARENGSHVVLCGYFRSRANDFLPELASRIQAPFCDFAATYNGFEARRRTAEILSADGAHPNAYGYSLMAKQMFDLLVEELNLLPELTPHAAAVGLRN